MACFSLGPVCCRSAPESGKGVLAAVVVEGLQGRLRGASA